MANETDTNREIAQTILDQMGGMGTLRVFVGAKRFTIVENGVRFWVTAKAAKAIKIVEVTLDPNDTYNVKFMGRTFAVKDSTDGAYAEDLMDIFERATKLYLSIGRRN